MSVDLEQSELERLHHEIEAALRAGDHHALNVLGFGEVSIALGCPTINPRAVCKRLTPANVAQRQDYEDLVERYVDVLGERGVKVAPSRLMSVARNDEYVLYLVQELLPADSIGDKVLLASEPDAEHPFLIALAEAVTTVDHRVSIDAQVTNWSWQDDTLTLIDVGTPFMWGEDGEWLLDLDGALTMLPAVARGYAQKDLTRVVARWKDKRTVAADIVANLIREGLHDWVDPTIARMNATLALSEPIRLDEAQAIYDEDKKTFPLLKKMQQVERFWCTRVRRRNYDFFIADSTYASS